MRSRYFFFSLLIFSSYSLMADPWKSLGTGDQTAKQLLKQMESDKKKVGNHPFFQSIPPESKLKENQIESRGRERATKDTTCQFIRESAESRPQFVFDPQNDPFIQGSEKLNPLEVIGGKGTHEVPLVEMGKDQILTCEEPGEPFEEACTHELIVHIIKRKIQRETPATIRLTGCRKSYKDKHQKECSDLMRTLSQLRHPRRVNRIKGPLEITNAYLNCVRDVITQQNSPKCPKCQNPRTTLPYKFPLENIKRVIVEKNPKGVGDISGETKYCSHGKLKGYDLTAHIKIFLEEETYDVNEDWVTNCDHLEKKVDSGLCSYGTKICSQGPETRIINEIPVKRECWQYTSSYLCDYPSTNTCGPLRAKGCTQVDSKCKTQIGNVCVLYTQTYQCKGGKKTTNSIKGGQSPFCLDGNCRDQSWDDNDEMMSSLAQLSILKEMQGQFKNGFLFKGEDQRCSKYILNFKDCCGRTKGWGKDIGLASCSKGEKSLHQKRKADLCHFVGTYCSKKVLGKCVKKKSSYCCFSSKLLRAFHEQGRPQINLGWGKVKEPLCRGFTVEEVQRIDFSKLDLRDVFEDLMKNYKPEKLQGTQQHLKKRIETLKKTILPNLKKPQKQRVSA